MKSLNIFYHGYCANDCYDRFMQSYTKIENSGLLKDCSLIYAVLVGEKQQEILDKISNLEKVKPLLKSNSSGEMDTLRFLWDVAQNAKEDFCALYLHSKGSSHGYRNPNIDSWIEYMEHFCITRYKDCVKLLGEYDTVGVNLQSNPLWHYSGNFWWANSSYIKQLDRFDVSKSSNPSAFSERWYCEFWLFDKMQAKACSLHQSNVDHYCSVYSKEQYER